MTELTVAETIEALRHPGRPVGAGDGDTYIPAELSRKHRLAAADHLTRLQAENDRMREAIDTSGRRVRHKKRGSTYTVIGEAEIQTSNRLFEEDRVTVYRCDTDGKIWARPTPEFEDGRFEPIEQSAEEVDRDGAP